MPRASMFVQLFVGHYTSVRPNSSDRFAKIQHAVDICPCSISATGRPRVVIARQKILHMAANRWRYVLLQPRLGVVLRILVQLIRHVFVNSLRLLPRRV